MMMPMEGDVDTENDELDEIRRKRSVDPSAISEVSTIQNFDYQIFKLKPYF